MTEENKKQCGCGRSSSGLCDGSHNLTNEQYKEQMNKQKEQLQENILLNEGN